MARTAALSRRLHALCARAERLDPEPRAEAIPADRVEFAVALGINPDPWQRDLLRSASSRVLMNCCRQSGKSTLAAMLALHQALTVPRSLALILAPALRQAQETYAKVAGYYGALGFPVPAESDRRLGLELANGSRIEALPGSEKTTRGFSAVDLLVLDEAARVDDRLYAATLPMLAVSRGRLVMMSTPNGKRGVFYETWRDGGPLWQRYEVPATRVPRIGAEQLAEAQSSMAPWDYEQEFCCAFGELEGAVFPEEMIRAAMQTEERAFTLASRAW